MLDVANCKIAIAKASAQTTSVGRNVVNDLQRLKFVDPSLFDKFARIQSPHADTSISELMARVRSSITRTQLMVAVARPSTASRKRGGTEHACQSHRDSKLRVAGKNGSSGVGTIVAFGCGPETRSGKTDAPVLRSQTATLPLPAAFTCKPSCRNAKHRTSHVFGQSLGNRK